MEIKIQLLSDLCTYSGESYNSMVDADVSYDRYGIPNIPAKRLKGCIREAALEMKELGMISQDQFEEIFGKEGEQRAAFSLSNACIFDYEETTDALNCCPYEELKTPQNVLDQYTCTRTQTAVDPESGVADENSLRTIRVVRKGLRFQAECNWEKEVSAPEILGQAVSLVKHIGMARTRGLGMVDMVLVDTEQRKRPHVLFEKKQLGEQNCIRYVIRLKSSLICKSPQGNQTVTEDYIAGSKILGLIAGSMKKDEYRELISGSRELTVSNAYVMNGKKRCTPARISFYKEKDQSYDSEGNMWLKDMLLVQDNEEIRNRQMVPAKIPYMDDEGCVQTVTTEISYHHQRPEDKSVGRATGEDGSSFYQLSAISQGQSFCGYIYADRGQAERIIEAVNGLGEIRMGYGRSSEFGAVDFVLDQVLTVKNNSQKAKTAVVTLVSDMLLYNERGMLSTDIQVLEQYLRSLTGAEDLKIENPYLRFAVTGGYNVTWKCRKPISYAFGKGSVFLINSASEVDFGSLDGSFIGERVSEGYGEIQVNQLEKDSNICVRKKKTGSSVHKLKMSFPLMECLLQSEFERRIQSMIREKLAQYQADRQNNAEGMKAAVSKLRVMFKNETSYESMKEQAAGIEKESKNKLCTGLINLINPDVISREVTEQMQKDYTEHFESRWTEQELFENVYRAYLTELKNAVKFLGQKGEC
ncbi:MAG: RAMP superfamily CRISPR-associated protein [Blautia caecimuris]